MAELVQRTYGRAEPDEADWQAMLDDSDLDDDADDADWGTEQGTC
jgi:hypothetical protein